MRSVKSCCRIANTKYGTYVSLVLTILVICIVFLTGNGVESDPIDVLESENFNPRIRSSNVISI